MNRTIILPLLAVGALALGAGATALRDGSADLPTARTAPLSAARVHLPGLAAPSGDPSVPELDTAQPPPGRVVQIAGPFDDRFVLDGLQVAGGVVNGKLRVTSDVSELLDLQLVVGFYDKSGQLLGRSTFEEHGHTDAHNGVPEREHAFEVVSPARDRAVSAAISVTVLVNE